MRTSCCAENIEKLLTASASFVHHGITKASSALAPATAYTVAVNDLTSWTDPSVVTRRCTQRSVTRRRFNSVAFAPYELGLVVAAASSDGSLSVLSHSPEGSWQTEKVRCH